MDDKNVSDQVAMTLKIAEILSRMHQSWRHDCEPDPRRTALGKV